MGVAMADPKVDPTSQVLLNTLEALPKDTPKETIVAIGKELGRNMGFSNTHEVLTMMSEKPDQHSQLAATSALQYLFQIDAEHITIQIFKFYEPVAGESREENAVLFQSCINHCGNILTQIAAKKELEQLKNDSDCTTIQSIADAALNNSI